MLNVSSSWNPFGIFFLIDQNVQIFFIGSMSIVGGRGCSCGVTAVCCDHVRIRTLLQPRGSECMDIATKPFQHSLSKYDSY